jgi:hypothetical protein
MMRSIIAAAALALSCNGKPIAIDKPPIDKSTDQVHQAMTTACDATLDSFLRKDLEALPGLPSSCTLDALGARLQLGSVDRRGFLGEETREAVYRGALAAGYDEGVQIWHRDGTVLKLAADLPQLHDVPALLAALGEPEARLDFYPSTLPKLRERGAWIYGKRGIALFLSGDSKNVIRVEVFSPMPASDYQRELFRTEPPREVP